MIRAVRFMDWPMAHKFPVIWLRSFQIDAKTSVGTTGDLQLTSVAFAEHFSTCHLPTFGFEKVAEA